MDKELYTFIDMINNCDNSKKEILFAMDDWKQRTPEHIFEQLDLYKINLFSEVKRALNCVKNNKLPIVVGIKYVYQNKTKYYIVKKHEIKDYNIEEYIKQNKEDFDIKE